MLLTVHNLPATTRYADIKSLLQSKCGLQHVILDNLIAEGSGKKVTVGVAEDADAAILVRKINGLYWNGQQLYVEDVRQQKSASEQPFRSMNPQPPETTDPSFRSMNLQQHSSFGNNTVTPAVQPLMTAMYYVPGYNQEYLQGIGNMQAGNFGQGQGYDMTEKVQSAYMGISGYSQTSTQISQVGMVSQFNNNQGYDQTQPGNQNSGWGDSYNEVEDFAAEKPLYGRRSPGNNRGPNWFPNQPRQRDSSPRDRSTDQERSWIAPRGSNTRGPRPDQPDFRSNRPDDRSGFKKPRLDFRQNDRPALLNKLNVRPEFVSSFKGQNPFSGRPNDFSGTPNKFSGKPNEFSGRPNEFSERPNQRQERPIEREGFPERPREFERPNQRHGPTEFSGRPNKFSGRPNEFSGRANERERRPNEFPDRKGRSNDRPGPSRPSERPEFNRSNGRDVFGRSNDRSELLRRGPNQRDTRPERGGIRPNVLESKKRKFDERFQEKVIERPQRVSRPTVRERPPGQANKPPSMGFSKPDERAEPMNEIDAEKRNKQIFLGCVRRIIFDIKTNLGIQDLDLVTRQAFNKFMNERLEKLLDGRKGLNSVQTLEIYRATYPLSDDNVAYNSILELAAQKKATEAAGFTPGAAEVFRQPAPPKLTKGEIKANRMFKEAKQLLAQGKVPTFPLGNKSLVAQQKREDKERFIPEVDDLHKKAMEVEINTITELLAQELDNAPNADTQKVYNNVDRKELRKDMNHNLTQALARRILDSGLKVVRIYGCPKLPKREVIEQFLLKYGVQSLRKSVKAKMYTAALDTFKNHDKLCSKESFLVADNITLSFKPFHVAPKPRADQRALKQVRKKLVKDMIEKSDLNLLDKDWPAKDAEIKEKQATEAAAKALELQALEAQKIAEEAEKKSEETLKRSEEPLKNGAEVDLTVNEPKDVSNEYLNDDFHVIDEVHENDSDVELIAGDEVVKIDEENDAEPNIAEKNDDNSEQNNLDVNDVNETVEGNDVSENMEGNDVSENMEGNDVSENLEGNAVNENVDGNDMSENDIEDEDVEENDVEMAYKAFEKSQNASIDVDVDIDDVDDDDLEDY